MPHPKKSAAGLRRLFLNYFENKDHQRLQSAPLIPQNDPTLMFVNAGMVPFKDLFTGAQTRDYKRAVSSQKCMRVAGKHNDLEAVGRTTRHHTFFEMLGNFSFGDYFKEEAIAYAWDFLLQEVGLDPTRLWITVFGGEGELEPDEEARALWKKTTGFSDTRIISMGLKDNFWSMGDTGPCGPCTEIHYDMRPQSARDTVPTAQDFDDGNIMEIWNNVFMQFNRHVDGSLTPLPQPSVDTGMGLERLAAIAQGVDSNYHSDLFLPIIEDIATASGKTYNRSDSDDDVAMRVIADHARATVFLVADGVQPSNEKRGYVMRLIMRRAIRFGRNLGFDELFFHRSCAKVCSVMAPAYPELQEAAALVDKVARLEEANFRRTLDHGLMLLDKELHTLKAEGKQVLAGDVAFTLYDTHGFPKDLTASIAEEAGIAMDEPGYAAALERQRQQSRGEHVGDAAVDNIFKILRHDLGPTTFVGYPHESVPLQSPERQGLWHEVRSPLHCLATDVEVRAMVHNGSPVQEVKAVEGMTQNTGLEFDLVLDPTPFYGESGGQVGDGGVVVHLHSSEPHTQTAPTPSSEQARDNGLLVNIINTYKPFDDFTVCKARIIHGTLRIGDRVLGGYNTEIRRMTRAHHSATHLIHGALRNTLGPHVQQKGSYVHADRLRFDYAHFESPTVEQLRAVENAANAVVQEGKTVNTEVLPIAEAKLRGAVALFGEKYGDKVRVVSMGPSVEFCGGTHVHNTHDIGLILLSREEGVAAGVRRIEAEVGSAATATCQAFETKLGEVAALLTGKELQVDPSGAGHSDDILLAVRKTVREYRALTKKRADNVNEAITAESLNIPTPLTLEKARQLRDTWTLVVQLTNTRAADAVEAIEAELVHYPHLTDGPGAKLLRTLAQTMHDLRTLQKAAAAITGAEQANRAEALLETKEQIGDTTVIMAALDNVAGKELRQIADSLRDHLGSGLVCLVAESEGKGALLIALTKDLCGFWHAGKLLKELAPLVGGRGGGKPDMAQGGAQEPHRANELFAALRKTLQSVG